MAVLLFLERIAETQRAVFLELEIAHVFITLSCIVEAGVYEKVGRNESADL